jgi:hypothetical protein
MAAASSTEVPPNFITTHAKRRCPASLLASDESFILSPWSGLRVRYWKWANKKPTGQLLLAVGLL